MSSVEEFRIEVRGWLRAHLTGEFAALARTDGALALIAERILGLPQEVRA
ncbi:MULTISPECIES: hypothetical protein [Streptomyces]|nr:hypothetical protein [Streptomyces virginiae]MCX4962149.1 hypothetical protein [Streptomyces virginiae]MCX5179903.1 hypothetical protein [Streptomyces virginiae]WTB25209.1 hypothetical protein OG253_29160 [Streptomyces virginiae]